MLNKKQRINGNLFKEIFKKGETKKSSHFICKFLKDEDIKKTKFAVVVPKKQIKKAIWRNFLRRRIYNAIKYSLKENTLPYSFIIFTKFGVSNLSFKEIKEEISVLITDVCRFCN